jgi:DNA-binding response OmpR family regulator
MRVPSFEPPRHPSGDVWSSDEPIRVLYGGGARVECLERHLAARGFRPQVVTVETRDACLARVATESFDVVVVDHPLPDGSALDVVRTLRAREDRPVIVVLTRPSQEGAELEAMRLGADAAWPAGDTSLAKLPLRLERELARRWLEVERDGWAVLTEALTAISGHRELEPVLDEFLRGTRRLLGTDRHLVLLTTRLGTLVPRAWDGFDGRALRAARFSAETGALARILGSRGEPLTLSEAIVRELPAPLDDDLAGGGLAVSLEAGSRTLGVLVGATTAARRFTALEATLLGHLARHAGRAIDQASRFETLRRRSERLRGALDLARGAGDRISLPELLGRLTAEVRRTLGGLAVTCRLLEGGDLVIAALAGEGDAIVGPTRLRRGEGLCGRIAATGMPLWIPDTRAAHPELGRELARLSRQGVCSFAGVPIARGDRVAGVLSVFATEPVDAEEEALAALAGFAGQAQLAVDHARLSRAALATLRTAAVGRVWVGVARELDASLRAEPPERVSARAQAAMERLRSVLGLAQTSAGERVALDVNQSLGTLVELLSRAPETDRVRLASEFAPDVPKISGDPVALQQAVVALVLTVAEALRTAAADATLTLATRFDPGRRRAAIVLSGVGSAGTAWGAPWLGEPAAAGPLEDERLRLALASCREVVEEHGGRLSVASRPGPGLTVTVDLPVAEEMGSRTETAVIPTAAQRGLLVLVVEDEPVVGDLLAEFLMLAGHTVDRAANGREALARIAERAYDLVVSDVRMPDLDGPALHQELNRRHPALARRMVLVTGDATSTETREFLEGSGLAYLEKPFGMADLEAAVRAALAERA